MVNNVERGGGSEPGEAGHGDAGAGGRRGHGSLQASAPQVVQQARLMDSAGTAWHAVKYGNLEMITQLFPSRCNVYARGPVGENVLHTAMLLNTPSTLAIARYLVKLYGPPLVNCPFTDRRTVHDPPSAYEGQTALHIAIVNRDIDMVKFLVQAGADIRARAWGTFFAPDGQMYYGEYPLSFAACAGQKEVVAHLKRHGAAVNSDRDMCGNTALHMCVIHDQPDMYDFLVDYCAANDSVRNYAGLTPLVLAAQLGKMEMFQHIYSRRRRAFYTFGRVTSYSLALREIDTVQDDGDGYVPNALEVILRKGHLEMLEEPLIKTLLRHKWQAFARTQFIAHFVGYLLLEVSQTVLIWLISSKTMWNGVERASQEYVGFTLALIMAFLEIIDYIQWSRESYQRRLTMVSPPPYQPPLYPIPGETREARDGRQGIFHRLSQRMMGSRNSHGGAPSSSSLELTPGNNDLGTLPPAATVGAQMAASTNAPRKLGDQPSRRFARPLSITESGSVTPAASPSPGATAGGADAQGQPQPPQQQAVARSGSARGPPSPFEHAQQQQQQQQQQQAEAPRPHVSFASGPRPLGEGRDPLLPAAAPSAPSPPPLAGGAAAAPEAPPPLVASVQDRLEAAAREEGSASEADPVDDDDDDDDGDVVSVGVAGRRAIGQGPGSGSAGAPVSASASRSPPRGPRAGEEAAEAAAGGGDGSARGPGARAGVPPQRIASFARTDSSGAPPLAPSSSGAMTGAASAGPLTALGASQSTGSLSATGRVGGGGTATAPSASNEGALHRQRTRARSGGGDLPSSISALKRVATSSGRHRGEYEGAEGYRSGGDGSGKGGGAGGAVMGGGSLGAGDLEAGTGPSTGSDPHKSRARAFLETTTEGFRRMLSDPWLFIWHTHLVLTFMHFITWTTTYGGVHGPGPSSRAVREFDDVVVSLMGLTGWLAVIYFFRGFKATGKLAVILERCLVDVVRFVSLYILWNIGFALALFTMTRGVLYVTDTPRDKEARAPLASTGDLGGGFTSIGFGMISLINLGLGLGLSEYGNICDLGHEVTSVFCTIYYLAYMATSVILLLNLLIAMIIRTYNTAQKAAEAHWRRRWAAYTVKAERRMPSAWVRRLRLGQPAWDPKTQRNLYSHVFETVDDDREGREDRGTLDAQIRAVADLLDTLRRQRGGPPGGGSGGGGGGGIALDKPSSKSAAKASAD